MNTKAEITSSAWESPSNIALVKYWGKKSGQIPANPSVSFTLDQAVSKTRIDAEPNPGQQGIQFDFTFEGLKNEAFEKKMSGFLELAADIYPWMTKYKLSIDSSNTFPHSSGIASSASAYSALALCLGRLDEKINGIEHEDFFRNASDLARQGSGSACRSVYGGYNVWGKMPGLEGSSDRYALNIDASVNEVFKNFSDTILIIEKGKKSVSSTAGHALLNSHPFAEERYRFAEKNAQHCLEILASGDLDAFIRLVESEALMLHALMMSSPTPFILMKPNTLAVIEKIIDFRNQSGLHLFFTLDAGANVHLLNPGAENEQIMDFVKNELVGYCQNGMYFCNAVGNGPVETI